MTIVSLSIFQFDQHRVIDRGPQQRQRKNHRSNRVSENVTNRTNVPGTRYTQKTSFNSNESTRESESKI